MTQPPAAAPTPPAQPTEDSSARDFFQQDDAALAAAWVPETLGEATPNEGGVELHLPEGDTTPAPTPSAETELPTIQRTPMTQFTVMDAQGELEIPDINIKFKAKGEERELPLDHVVRLAQLGFTNEEREQQVLAARRFVSEAQDRESQYQERIQRYEQHYNRIFNDPNFYEEARVAFLSQHTPEARATRAEQENVRLRANNGRQAEDQQIHGFVQQVLVPATSSLLGANPLVSETELVGRYSQLTAPLLVQGRIPVSRLAEVQRVVEHDLKDWVERTHVERLTAQKAQERKSQQATAQVAQTKRAAARVFAPTGGVPSDQAKPTKFVTAKDWLNSTFHVTDEE